MRPGRCRADDRHQTFPELLATAGQVHVAPDLQIEQAPDAIGGVVNAAIVLVEQIVEVREVHVGREQAVGIAQVVADDLGLILHAATR